MGPADEQRTYGKGAAKVLSFSRFLLYNRPMAQERPLDPIDSKETDDDTDSFGGLHRDFVFDICCAGDADTGA